MTMQPLLCRRDCITEQFQEGLEFPSSAATVLLENRVRSAAQNDRSNLTLPQIFMY